MSTSATKPQASERKEKRRGLEGRWMETRSIRDTSPLQSRKPQLTRSSSLNAGEALEERRKTDKRRFYLKKKNQKRFILVSTVYYIVSILIQGQFCMIGVKKKMLQVSVDLESIQSIQHIQTLSTVLCQSRLLRV